MTSNDVYVIGTFVGFGLTLIAIVLSPERAISLAILTAAWYLQPWAPGE